MSRKQKQEILWVSCVLTFYSFHCSHSVSVGMREDGFTSNPVRESSDARWESIQRDAQQGDWHPGREPKSDRLGVKKHRPESPAFPADPVPPFGESKLDERPGGSVLGSLSWTSGHVSQHHGSSDSKRGYQSDFAGFPGVEGRVSGPSFYSHSSEWLAMRPLVRCDHNVMTFTASGGGFTHLLVDREGASPVSLFHLPPYCGYSVRMSWSDLEMMVPYDACYITQENGSFVLPLLWWGSPLNLSCPTQVSTPVPSVFCSPYGMAVQIFGQEQDILTLGAKVNGGWGPFVNEECASLASSQPGQFIFFIPFTGLCVTVEDGHDHIWLVVDELEYTLTCPVSLQFPSSPPPPSPGDPQIPLHPPYLPYPYPDFQFPQLPQLYPPGPQPARPSKPTPGSPPGPQPQQPVDPSGPGQKPYSPAEHTKYPYPPQHFPSQLPVGAFQYPSRLHPSYLSYYSAVAPSQSSTTKKPTTTAPPATQPPSPPVNPYYLQYYPYPLFYPVPQVTQTPAPPTPSPPPPTPQKQPVLPQHPFGLFYPPGTYSSYYSYGQGFYQNPTFGSTPPATDKPQTIQEPQPNFCPDGHTCSYYPNPYNPYYLPHRPILFPPVPPHPETTQQPTTTSSTFSTSTQGTSQSTQFQCLKNRIKVFLRSVGIDSIRIRDQKDSWVFVLAHVHCGYRLEVPDESMVIFNSPLLTCHSKTLTPTTTSLSLRFWNKTTEQYGTMDVQCPLHTPTNSPAQVTPRSTKRQTSTSVAPQVEVFCSPHQMILKLPSGPISGIIIKDLKGNEVKLQDAPKGCGYSASKSNDGKIRLSLPLRSRCHMSMQGTMYIITVVYMTFEGIREAQFSCPGAVPGTGQECNLPSEQRLPCGHGSVSQPQCLSMGCCFSKHPPACYYPMDECTIDRHFVFSVPASLTEPPLSPPMLVAASDFTCKPEKVTPEYALFKIPMDGCGARRVQMGKTVIYMVEIINAIQTISLSYSTITRDSPIRLLVECRFLPGTVLTVSYLVKTPTLGPAVQTQGVFGVQLRIAKDAQYSSYYPQYHQPLQMLLGKPLYLEVRLLNTPDPTLVLLVHYCVAYSRSGTAVWNLLYNGCPNPFDPASEQAALTKPQPPPPPQAQTRRFTISTFLFLPEGEFKDLNEEIYFMCSTEICSPRVGPCLEGCFG